MACTAGRRRQPWPAKRCVQRARITVEHRQLQIGIKRLTCSRRNGTRSALEARHNALYKSTTTTTTATATTEHTLSPTCQVVAPHSLTLHDREPSLKRHATETLLASNDALDAVTLRCARGS